MMMIMMIMMMPVNLHRDLTYLPTYPPSCLISQKEATTLPAVSHLPTYLPTYLPTFSIKGEATALTDLVHSSEVWKRNGRVTNGREGRPRAYL